MTASHVLAAADPDRYDLEPVGITRDGRVGAGRRRPRPPSRRGAGARCPTPWRPPGRAIDHEPAIVPHRRRRAGRRVPAAARPAGRGRHRAGPARAGRRALRRLRRARLGLAMDKAMAKDVLAADGHPPGPLAGLPQQRPRRPAPRRDRTRAGAARVREAGEHGLLGRRLQGPRPRRARPPPSSWRSATTSGSWSRRPSWAARSSGGARQHRPAGVGARRDHPGGRVLRLRGQVPRRRGRADHPGRPARRGHRRSSRTWPCRPTGRCGPRAWPGSTSSTRRAVGACCSTRSTPSPASRRSRCTRSCGRPPACPTPSSSTSWSRLALERHERRTKTRRTSRTTRDALTEG